MIAGFLSGLRTTYIGNPTSVRDFRTQLRGGKAVGYLTAYLVLMILMISLIYASVTSGARQSVSEIQGQLRQVYDSLMLMLELVGILIGPALGGTLMVSEYSRRSIDLVAASPMSPKTLLMGKLISAWRLIWMLLALSLPMAAVTVVMGGAAWGEVLEAYVLIAMRSLVYASIALPIAVMSQKVAPTVGWSYGALAVIYMLGAMSGIGSFGSMMMSSGRDVPVQLALIPFTSGVTAGATTDMFGQKIPFWIPAIVLNVILARVFVLGAESVMTRYGSRETMMLRLVGIGLAALAGWSSASLVGMVAGFSGGMGGRAMGSGAPSGLMIGTFTNSMLIPVGFLLPSLVTMTCWTLYGERREMMSGILDFRNVLKSSPATALPYLGLLYGTSMLVASGVIWSQGTMPVGEFIAGAVWLALIVLMLYSLGRLASSMSQGGIAVARKLHVGLLLVATLLPVPPILIFTASLFGSNPDAARLIWAFYPFAGPYLNSIELFLVNVVLIAIYCSCILAIAERLRIQVMAKAKVMM